MALEKSVFPHVANSYANLSEQRHVLRTRRGSTPTRLVWDTNMAALFGGGHQYGERDCCHVKKLFDASSGLLFLK